MSNELQQLEAQLASAATPKEKIDVMNALAWELKNCDEKRALALSEEAHQLATTGEFETHPYKKGLADSLLTLAALYYRQGDYGTVLSRAFEAQTLYDELDLPKGQIRVLTTFAITYIDLSEYPAALEYNLEALQLAEAIGDQRELVNILANTGIVHSMMGEYRKALHYYDRCLKLCREIGLREREAANAINCSQAYYFLGEYQQAAEYASRALSVYRENGGSRAEMQAYGNLGVAYAYLKDDDQALPHLQKALELAREGGWKYSEVVAIIDLTDFYIKRQQADQALPLLEQGLIIAESIDSKTLIYQCHQHLAEAHELRQDVGAALHHYKQFHSIKEVVFNEESDQRIRNLQVLHETEQARQETERQKQLREEDRRYFERLSQMKDDYMYTASHDLKNPLAIIKMDAFMLKEQFTDDPDVLERAERIDSQIARMRDLIKDLLDIARIETGRSLELTPISITSLVKTAVQGFEPMAQEKKLQFQFETAIQDVTVNADLTSLRQVLDNLISNAIKYTPAVGKVNVIIEPDSEKLTIKVIDNGIGISPDDLPHVFERFYRVKGKAHNAVEGTGLGLSIAKAIVEQHGGNIRAESKPGKGSTFSFTLSLSETQPV